MFWLFSSGIKKSDFFQEVKLEHTDVWRVPSQPFSGCSPTEFPGSEMVSNMYTPSLIPSMPVKSSIKCTGASSDHDG